MGKQTAKFRLGNNVRKLRFKRGWTQKKLACRAGISERYLQKIESSHPPDITLDTLDKLARGLNLKCWELV